MDNMLDEKLSHAFELIEANRIDEARGILEPLTEEHPDNVDVWWMYAHAVDSPQDAQRALQNIMRIDPDYPGANELLAETEATAAASRPEIKPIKPLTPASENDDDDDLSDFEDEESTPANRGVLIGIAALFALVAVAVLAFSLINTRGTTPPPTSPQVANQATDVITATSALGAATNATESAANTTEFTQATETETDSVGVGDEVATATPIVAEATETPTNTVVPTATDAPTETPEPTDTASPTDAPTATPVDVETVTSLFQSALGELTQPDSDAAVGLQETDLGETLTYQVCVDFGQERDAVLDAALEAFASVADELPSDELPADAVAVTLFDCEAEIALRTVGANLADVVALSNGELDQDSFRVRLTVID